MDRNLRNAILLITFTVLLGILLSLLFEAVSAIDYYNQPGVCTNMTNICGSESAICNNTQVCAVNLTTGITGIQAFCYNYTFSTVNLSVSCNTTAAGGYDYIIEKYINTTLNSSIFLNTCQNELNNSRMNNEKCVNDITSVNGQLVACNNDKAQCTNDKTTLTTSANTEKQNASNNLLIGIVGGAIAGYMFFHKKEESPTSPSELPPYEPTVS